MKPLLIALGLSLITLTARAELPTHEFQLRPLLNLLASNEAKRAQIFFRAPTNPSGGLR